MTPSRCRRFVAFCILFAAASLWAAPKPTDEEAIRGLISRYAAAVDAADPAQASQIWSHAPEASFIHPLGEEHGLQQIEQDVYTHLMGETFSERHLEPHDIAVHVYGNAAWAVPMGFPRQAAQGRLAGHHSRPRNANLSQRERRLADRARALLGNARREAGGISGGTPGERVLRLSPDFVSYANLERFRMG